ncbi:hypothetical protein KQX54_013277 [Cotesia glomerata]|uniref:Reverse transcriptase domain-containing protein n=1 Tax=Cotesia glomerata TaxID=32391 RepID=A0AAV7IWF5_COTGL|nr:hypothetical protein KQX54_013277 [Cotesia glomerata]
MIAKALNEKRNDKFQPNINAKRRQPSRSPSNADQKTSDGWQLPKHPARPQIRTETQATPTENKYLHLAKNTEFQLKQVSPNNNITVSCNNLETFVKVNKIFFDKQQQYYTYTPKSQKPKTIVLKGVKGGFTAEDIKTELLEMNIPNVSILKVQPVTFKNANGHEYTHHLVQVTNTKYLTSTIWSMINNRSFYTWDDKIKSSKLFNIREGLQQGTVNSPTLFNIFTSHILNAFKLNQNNNTYSIAYADDLIIYVAAKYPKELKDQLETIVNKINNIRKMEPTRQSGEMRNHHFQETCQVCNKSQKKK